MELEETEWKDGQKGDSQWEDSQWEDKELWQTADMGGPCCEGIPANLQALQNRKQKIELC